MIFRAGPTWMRRGTQGHVAAPRGPMRRLRGVHLFIFILHILYTNGIQPSVYRKGIQPFKPSRIMYPLILLKLLHVGLKPFLSGKIDCWIEARDASRVNTVNQKSTTASITHVSYKRNCNGQILCDVAASHTSITWTRGPPEIINARAFNWKL